MSGESILLQTELARARAVNETVESWRPEGPAEEQVRSAEELIEVFEALPAEMERLYQKEYARAVRDGVEVEHLRRTREGLSQAFYHVAQAALHFDRKFGQLARQVGHALNGAGRLKDVQTAVERLRERLDEEWPVCTGAEAAELSGAPALAADEAFAQIAGVDKAEWLRRVEEHKRRAAE
jgi:hypothetical protein